MVKRIIIILICLIGITTNQTRAQATTTLSIDSAYIATPIIMGGFTDFHVQVRVNSLMGADSLYGDIFYYYLTDSMINAGDTARIFLQDAINEPVVDPFLDTISIDILPNEIRTSGPMNLIVIWPAMFHPSVGDTDSVTFYVNVEGYIGLPPFVPHEHKNILFPCPALQFLYIRQDELDLIQNIVLLNSLGQQVAYLNAGQLTGGWMSIEQLVAGNYLALIQYKNGEQVTMKFIKQ